MQLLLSTTNQQISEKNFKAACGAESNVFNYMLQELDGGAGTTNKTIAAFFTPVLTAIQQFHYGFLGMIDDPNFVGVLDSVNCFMNVKGLDDAALETIFMNFDNMVKMVQAAIEDWNSLYATSMCATAVLCSTDFYTALSYLISAGTAKTSTAKFVAYGKFIGKMIYTIGTIVPPQ